MTYIINFFNTKTCHCGHVTADISLWKFHCCYNLIEDKAESSELWRKFENKMCSQLMAASRVSKLKISLIWHTVWDHRDIFWQMLAVVEEMKFWPYSFNTLCFSFVESKSMLGLRLSCPSFLWFLLLFSMAKLICISCHWSNLLLHMQSGALSEGVPEVHNLACLYPQQAMELVSIGRWE